VPINLVRLAAQQIVDTGRVSRGFLGVAPQRLTPELATQFGTDHGALIAEVTPGSAAEKAGLQIGDVITKINETEIRDPRQLLVVISQLAPETKVTVQYVRDGHTQTASATLTRRTDEKTTSRTGRGEGEKGSDVGVLNGVAVGDISPEAREQFQIPERIQGAIITSVDPDSASARQGLREGDVIISLDRKPVKNAAEAVRLSTEIKGPKVTVLLWREGHSQFVVIDESGK